MGFLRKSRECALQMLYQWDLAHAEPNRIESMFWKATRGSSEQRFLANKLFEGAAADAPVTDELIGRYAENWRIDRLAAIDRNILRLAAHELRRGETPEKVVINEALELAKKYSEPDAVGFINAVLDAIRKSLAAAKDA
jgi:transcription antitermination protein NusB